MVPAPEKEARETIDKLLTQAGWLVCDASQVNIHAARGRGGSDEGSVNLCPAERVAMDWQPRTFSRSMDSAAKKAIREFPLKLDHGFAVIRTFRDKLFTEIFPGRTWVPKTLIFAKSEAESGEHPVNVRPAERAGHRRPALGFRAERDARAKNEKPTVRLECALLGVALSDAEDRSKNKTDRTSEQTYAT